MFRGIVVLAGFAVLMGAESRAQVLVPSPAQVGLIDQHLGVAQWSVQQFEFESDADDRVLTGLRYEGEDFLLVLDRHSIRSADFEVRREGDGEDWMPVEVPAHETYRGPILGPLGDEGTVRVSIHDGQMQGVIFWNGQRPNWDVTSIMPLQELDPAAPPGAHLMYDADPANVTDSVLRCGVDDSTLQIDPIHDHLQEESATSADEPKAEIVEIAVDADSAYFGRLGNDEDAAIRDIENVINVVDELFDKPGIDFELTFIIIRDQPGKDPYLNRTDSVALLNTLASIWENPDRDEHRIHRDIAHLFTGNDIDFGVIGIAALATVCTSQGYGVSETLFTNLLNFRAALTAHEIGHNFSALHCDSLPGDRCHIMCSVIGNCGQVDKFGNPSRDSIVNHANSRNCLHNFYGKTEVPFFDDFDDGDLDGETWTFTLGQGISDEASNEVSGENSLNVIPFGEEDYEISDYRTTEIKLQQVDAFMGEVYLSFFTQCLNLEQKDSLEIEYYSTNGRFETLFSLFQPDTDDTEFHFRKVAIPDNGFHKDFRLRVWSNSNKLNDECYVDNLLLSIGGINQIATELTAGSTAEFKVFGAEPTDAEVYLFYSLTGIGEGLCLPDNSACMEILQPCYVLDSVAPDADGIAAFQFPVPAVAAGTDFFTQALIPRTTPVAVLSNPLKRTVQP